MKTLYCRWRKARSGDDAGFSLIEVIVALSILVVTAVFTAPVFINSLARTATQGSRQAAVTVASQQLEYVRSLRGADLVKNRPQSYVTALDAAPGLADLSQDILAPVSGTDLLNYDPLPAQSDGSASTVKMTQTQTLNNVAYTIKTFIDGCWLAQAGSACTRAPATYGHQIFRVTVDVTWPRAKADICASATASTCEYDVATLRDPSSDPLFSRLSPPTFTSLIETYQLAAVTPAIVHPGQQVGLAIAGTNIQYNATLTSTDPGDTLVTTPVTTTPVLTQFTPSSALGPHSLVLANPDGGSVLIPVTVAASIPTVSAATPGTARVNLPLVVAVTGTDFFTSATGVVPTVTLSGLVKNAAGQVVAPTYTNATGVVTMTSTKALSVTYAAANFPSSYSGFTFSGNLVVANADGGTVSFPYSLAIS